MMINAHTRAFRACRTGLLALTLLPALAGCGADILSREPTGGSLDAGQSALVDDGRCPAGQVSRVTGPATLTSSRIYACVHKPSSGFFF